MAAVVLVVYDGGRARFAESTVGSSWLSGPLRCRWRVSLPPARVIASARKNCEILRRFDETAAVFVARYWNAKPRLHGYLGNIPPEDYERNYMLKDTTHQPVTPPPKRRYENRDRSRKRFARCWVPSISSWLGPVNRASP